MQCFMIVFLYLLFVLGSEGITTHSVTGCSYRVLLNCSVTEMIHVERITFYNGTDCNQAITDLQVCGQPVTGSDTGLVSACNGRVSCREIVHSYCPDNRAAKVDYRCIPGSNTKDMCDEIIIENTNSIFLSTPNYPLSPTFTDISPCRCFIRGSGITFIQILELLLRSTSDGTKSSLEINYGDGTYKTESFSDTTTRRVYNKRLSPTSTTAEIIFNHNGVNRQYLWIEIQGVSTRISCKTGTNEINDVTSSPPPRLTPPTSSPSSSSTSPTSSSSTSPSLTITTSSPPLPSSSSLPPPPSSTSTTPSSPTSSQSVSEEPNIEPSSSTDSSSSSTTTTHPPQTADITSHSPDKDTTIIILAVLLTLCLLMMCITAIIIIVLLRRKKLVWVKTSPRVEREGNPYSGLDLNQRVAGNDGTYQELNTRTSTPQYNNVSQNTHNDDYNLN